MNTLTDLDKTKLSYFHLGDLRAGNFGQTGPPGPAGPIGPAGFNGVKGDTGDVGPQGPQGPQGVQGPIGNDGPVGPVGPQGLQGVEGLVGPVGPLGPTGPQGAPGVDGADGVDGANGLDGADGANGLDGVDGVDGIDGADGAEGPPGVDGADGVNGVDGADGINGIDGAEGPAGPPGADGINGIDGTNGVDGADGINGVDGADGFPGPPGAVGATGPQGIQGIQGIQGNDGPPGADGVDGLPGAAGPQGPEGPQGIQGIQGGDGYPGPEGPIGPQGPQGTMGSGVISLMARGIGNYTFAADQMMLTSGVVNLESILGSVSYSSSTGLVSVSEDGLYQVSFTVRLGEATAGKEFRLRRSRTPPTGFVDYLFLVDTGYGSYTFTRLLPMMAGDTLTLSPVVSVALNFDLNYDVFQMVKVDNLASVILTNGGFEQPLVDPGTSTTSRLATGWTGSGIETGGGWGLCHQDSGLIPRTTNGFQALWMQGFNSVSQDLTIGAGTYKVYFAMMGRPNPYGAMPLRVSVNGVEVFTVDYGTIPLQEWATYEAVFTTSYATGSGVVALTFETHTRTGDHMTFIDNVQVVRL